MTDLLLDMLALVGGLSLVFAAMAAFSDYLIPAIARRPWRTNRRPAATRRAK